MEKLYMMDNCMKICHGMLLNDVYNLLKCSEIGCINFGLKTLWVQTPQSIATMLHICAING